MDALSLEFDVSELKCEDVKKANGRGDRDGDNEVEIEVSLGEERRLGLFLLQCIQKVESTFLKPVLILGKFVAIINAKSGEGKEGNFQGQSKSSVHFEELDFGIEKRAEENEQEESDVPQNEHLN